MALAIIVGSQLSAHLLGRLSPRRVAVGAFGLAAVGALLLSRLSADASVPVHVLPGFLLVAVGVGAAFVTATTTAMAQVDPEAAGLTSGLLNTCHELGSSLGVAFVSAIAAASVATDPLAGRPPVGGFDHAFLALALVAALVAAAALRLLPAGRSPAGDPSPPASIAPAARPRA